MAKTAKRCDCAATREFLPSCKDVSFPPQIGPFWAVSGYKAKWFDAITVYSCFLFWNSSFLPLQVRTSFKTQEFLKSLSTVCGSSTTLLSFDETMVHALRESSQGDECHDRLKRKGRGWRGLKEHAFRVHVAVHKKKKKKTLPFPPEIKVSNGFVSC